MKAEITLTRDELAEAVVEHIRRVNPSYAPEKCEVVFKLDIEPHSERPVLVGAEVLVDIGAVGGPQIP